MKRFLSLPPPWTSDDTLHQPLRWTSKEKNSYSAASQTPRTRTPTFAGAGPFLFVIRVAKHRSHVSRGIASSSCCSRRIFQRKNQNFHGETDASRKSSRQSVSCECWRSRYIRIPSLLRGSVKLTFTKHTTNPLNRPSNPAQSSRKNFRHVPLSQIVARPFRIPPLYTYVR